MSLAEAVPKPRKFAPEPKYHCAECRDRGWVMSNAGRKAYSRCRCQTTSTDGPPLRNYLGAVGMSESEIGMATAEWDSRVESRIRRTSIYVSQGWGGGNNSPNTIALLGVPGSGKTMTAAHCVAEYLYAGGTGVRWVHVPTDTRTYLSMPSERREIDARVHRAELVVMDEAGAVKDQFSDIWMGWFFQLIRANKKVILSANALSLSEFEPRVSSRLKQGVHGVLSDVDYRERQG